MLVYSGAEYEPQLGTWVVQDVRSMGDYGRSEYKTLKCTPEGSYYSDDLDISDSGISLRLDDFGTIYVYIHEDYVGTAATDDELARMVPLSTSNWIGIDSAEGTYLHFNAGGDVTTSIVSEDGSQFEVTNAGRWSYEGGTYTLEWSDGSTDNCSISEDGSLVTLSSGYEYKY